MSASPDSSPGSTPRPFSFGDLGRPRPNARLSRLLPPIPDADPSADELSADDILESNDIEAIDAFEEAATNINIPAYAPLDAPMPVAAKSSGFEVADMGPWDEVEVEGLAARATEPSPPPAAIAIIAQIEIEPAPVSMKIEYTSLQPSTLIGFPAAPITSPLPLEDSVIVEESVQADCTLELKGDTTAKIKAAAAQLDNPEQTQVLVRSQMPAELQAPRTLPTGHTPPPTSVNTPSMSLAATSPAWQNGRHPQSGRGPVASHAAAAMHARPSSVAPVALDARARPTMPSIPVAAPVPQKSSGMSGVLIGGIAFAAAALIGVVGVGGYLASRTLSNKAESIAIAPAPQVGPDTAVTAPGAPAAPAAAAAADPAAAPADPVAAADPAAAPAPVAPVAPVALAGVVDVSSLPTAPAPRAIGAAPVAASPASPAPAPAAPAPRTVVGSSGSRASAPSSPSPQAPSGKSGSAGAPLAAPGGGTQPAPPPAAVSNPGALPPPPAKVAPAAPAAVASSTGTVNVDPKLRAIVVDGSFRRVSDGAVTLTCGAHRIKVGMNDVQSVNVPCGGSVSL